MKLFNCEFREGRAAGAPMLRTQGYVDQSGEGGDDDAEFVGEFDHAQHKVDDDDCLALRAAIVALSEMRQGRPTGRLHIIEFYARKQVRINRSTLSTASTPTLQSRSNRMSGSNFERRLGLGDLARSFKHL